MNLSATETLLMPVLALESASIIGERTSLHPRLKTNLMLAAHCHFTAEHDDQHLMITTELEREFKLSKSTIT
jgi:hypothetical protein